MGWHLCIDYDSCFQAIWQPCMEVHMTAGGSPVAKWRQQSRLTLHCIEFRVSLDTDGEYRLICCWIDLFHYTFFFLKVISITSHRYSYCQTTSSLSLTPKWGVMSPQTSKWAVQNRSVRADDRWVVGHRSVSAPSRRGGRLTCWSETCVRGATAHTKTAGCHTALGCAAWSESRADTSIIGLIRPGGTRAETKGSVPQQRCHGRINALFYWASTRPNLLHFWFNFHLELSWGPTW